MRKPGWELYGRRKGESEVYEGFFEKGEFDLEDVKEYALETLESSHRGYGARGYDSVVVKDARDRRKVLYTAKGV